MLRLRVPLAVDRLPRVLTGGVTGIIGDGLVVVCQMVPLRGVGAPGVGRSGQQSTHHPERNGATDPHHPHLVNGRQTKMAIVKLRIFSAATPPSFYDNLHSLFTNILVNLVA
jgi:hypothetical protein